MKLFEVAKVGMCLDSITHGVEERAGEEVKVVTLTLRVQPFGADLARACDARLRTSLFALNTSDPLHHLKRVEVALGVPRQQLHVFASPDTTKASICLDQVKIVRMYARTQKDLQGYAFVVQGRLGPVDKAELMYLQDWLLGQRFVTCEVAEPGLFDDDEPDVVLAPQAERELFEADDPLVLDGTYDQQGYKPGERQRIAKARARAGGGGHP